MIRNFLSSIALFVRLWTVFGFRNAFRLINNYNHTTRKIKEYTFPGFSSSLFLRNNQTDYRLLVSIFCHQEYGSKWIFKYIKQAKLIVDAGANIGLFSIFINHHYPEAQIVSVEPEDDNFEMLTRNTREKVKIKLIKAAVWPYKTFVSLDDEGEGDWAFKANEASDTTLKLIPTVTISDILEQSGFDKIDILKIDIEGSERELFQQNYDSWLSRVNCIIIELHDYYRMGCGNSFFKAVSKYDFFFTKKGENLIFIKSELIQSGR